MASYGSSSSGSSSESGKTYEKNYENQSGYIKPKKPVNKKLIAGLACAIAAIGIGGGVGGWLYSTRDVRAARKAERLALEQQRQEKENTIALIQTYSSQGLYDNSLSLINGLLLKDNQDTDGNSLFNTTAQLKKDSDPHAGFSGQTFTDPFGNESYDSSKHSNAISIAQRYVDTALYDDASTVLNALLVDNPEDDEAKQMLDMAMTFRERASEETLKAEAEQAASDRQNALKQANDAVDSGLYDQAIAVLEALAAKDPNDAEVRSLLEKASFLKEEADKAEAARNARLAKEEAEQAEKERKANEAAANQALKDQLAARASLSNEGNAGQNPPVYSEMANVITPSSGTGTQAAKNTGSSANGTSSDSKHKYSNPNAQSQGARNEGSSLADLVSETGSQVAKNTGTSAGNTSANSTSSRSEASTPKTVKTVVSNTPSSNAASSGSSAGNASSGTGTSSANRPAASTTASSTAVAANTGTSSSSRNAPATNASASSSSSSGTGNASAGNSAANASGTASSSTGTASGSAGKASASTGSPSAANTNASQTRPAVNASTGKSSAKPITVDRSTGNVRTPSSREEALARATELTDEGRYDDALRILNDLMIRNPNDKDALLRMYRAADEKRELLRRNRKGDSSSLPSAEELSQRKKQDQLSLAQKYLDAGDYEKAQQILNELAKTNKGDSQIQNMLNKANAQAKAAEEKAAREKAEKLAQEQKAAKDKADKLAQAQKALEAGDYDKAQQILNSIPANQRGDSDVTAMRNKIASEKQAAQAKAAAEKAAKDKADKLAQAQKALDSGDYAKAQQILNELAKTNKGDSQIQNMLNKANAQAKAAEEKAAREKAEKLAQEQKAAKDKADKLAQAQKALEAGDYDKAQQILNSIPANQRGDSDVTAMRNKIASEKQAAQAKAAAEKAAKDKADKLAQAQKALDSGDYAKAQQILNELAKTNKGDSQIQNMLNKANAQAKAAEEKAAAQKAAEQQAAQKAAQEKADKLAQAQKALEAGDYDKAQQILNSIPANQRSDSDVNAMRNKIASAKQAADAKAAAEKAAKEKSDKLAQAQKALEAGDYDKAQQILNSIPSAQRSDPDVNALRNKIASEKQAAQAKAAAEKAAQEKADKLAQAQKALEAGDYDKAQQILNSIPANQRSDSDVTALRNKIASEKQAAQAKAQAEKAAQEKADKLAQAQKALDAGDYAKAQAILNTLPSSEKRDTDVQALISKAAAQEKEALAKKAAEEERVKKAAEEAEKAKKQAELAALQKDIDSEIAKGKAALAAGNVEEAIAHFNKAMSMLPSDDPTYAAKKKSEIAQALYDASEATDNPADKKKLADAAKTLANEAVAKGSDDAGSHYVLGMEALKNKNYAQAEAEFEKAIKADPKNASYYYQLGRAQAQQGKFKAAQASFKNSTELNPKFAPAFYNLGYVSERLNDNSQALVSYRKAYQIDGEYERAYIAAGRIMARQGDNQGASAAFDKAIKINPANSQTYQEYGSALAAIGNYSAAENSFKKAIAYMDKSKADPATYYNLSTVLLAQEKNSEALSYAKQSYELKASANDELKNNITYNYALAQEKTDNAELAKSLYNEVLLNDPNNVKARTNLGALYNEDGQSDSAIAVLSKAYELDSSNFEVNNNLGNAYNKKENFTQAIKYYQNALAISPKDNTVRANLAKAYAGAKQYDSAKVAYEDVIAANPKDWESYLELSKVCIALGDMESAETYLTYLQKNNPTYKMAEVAKLLASIKK